MHTHTPDAIVNLNLPLVTGIQPGGVDPRYFRTPGRPFFGASRKVVLYAHKDSFCLNVKALF